MEPREIILVIWKRMWAIVLGTLVFAALVLFISLRIQPVYEARVLLAVEQTDGALSQEYASSTTGENLALTYSILLKTRPIIEAVIANLSLDLSPEYIAEEMVTTNLIQGTQLLELTVQDTNPRRASEIANEIAFTFIYSRDNEQKLQSVKALEEDVVAQMAILKGLIDRSEITRADIETNFLTDQELSLAQSTLSNQQLAYTRLMEMYLSIRTVQGQLLDVRIVEPSVPPSMPIRPNVPLYTFLGAFIGLVLCVGITFLVEYLDRSIKTDDDVRHRLSLPTLGTILQSRSRKQDYGLVTLKSPRAPVSETYRTLRTNLRFASFDTPLRTLLITSARPGEGKTTVACNLGVVYAQAGVKVLLIDADLRRPHLHQLFHLPNEAGLTDFLVGNFEHIEEGILETDVDNLRIICGGQVPPNPSELLSSEKMTAVLEEAQQLVDLVIVDAPPTLHISDALVLASRADGVLLVIEAGKTTLDVARKSCGALKQVGSRILGVVLTKVKPGSSRAYNYYI